MDLKTHWETLYRTTDVHDVSWFQSEARRSLELISQIAPAGPAPIIDVGAGASVLVDNLLAAGYEDLTVLDLAEAALDVSRRRLGDVAARVHWLAADILRVRLDQGAYAVWHDRAVFHFLPNTEDREISAEQFPQPARRGGPGLVAVFARVVPPA